MAPVTKPVPYNFDPAFEKQVVTLACARPRFWGRVGVELDPELFKTEAAKLAMRAARSISDEVGHGPGSPVLVIQRLRRWMADGKCPLEDIKKVAQIFDDVEDAGLLDDDEVIAELTPMLQERMRKDAVKVAIESYGKKGDLSKAVALEEKAARMGLPDVLHDDGPGWPEPLGEAAYHGLLGEIVRRVEPHSEADPAAVLVQTLVAFGSAVGPGPHFMAEATPHSTNMFAVVVGQSSRARKGTSWGHVRRFLSDADPIWAAACIASGLRTGEGLANRFMPVRNKGKTADVAAGIEPEDEEDGLPDRRCLVVEDELGTLLRSLQRDGNTLSPMLRQAWQGGDLETMTKVTPIKVTGVHVSVIGHITQAELKQLLATTDALNGFANRFLWVCAKRSKHLPDGGSLADADRQELAARLTIAIEGARAVQCIARDESARALWHHVYGQLTAEDAEHGQIVDAVVSRGEAQVARLAFLYALLDESDVVRVEHLEAALAVWTYCAASARYIFGAEGPVPLERRVLRLLRDAAPAGKTTTDLHTSLGRHVRGAALSAALDALLTKGRVRQSDDPSAGGRPAKRFFAVATPPPGPAKKAKKAASSTGVTASSDSHRSRSNADPAPPSPWPS